jgi:redox-sensitive bicupin YhaK (pirin superfamily)
MLPQSQGKIFLADERGLQEQAGHRRYLTFNAEGFYNRHKTPFGALYALHEDTLEGGKSISLNLQAATDILLVPTVGAISWQDHTGQSGLVTAGQSLYYTGRKDAVLTITNPYDTALVNFLQWWFKSEARSDITVAQLTNFDLQQHKDQLIAMGSQTYIGMFNGRTAAVHTIARHGYGLFVFVLEGAFEVQHRLLNAGDGLALWNIQEVELEALSNNAIVLLAEVALMEEQL